MVVASSSIVGLVCGTKPALADDIKHRPVNPAFGGSPFNADYLLNQARIQNECDDPAEVARTMFRR